MNYSNRYLVITCSRPKELALIRWTSNELSYLVEDNVLCEVCDIDSAAYNLNYERRQRLYSYSNRIVVDAKMIENEHLLELAIAT